MAEEEHFEKHRPLLFSIAYRMLGSVADAEDVVQEVYLRWRGASEVEEVRSPRAYLSTVVTRLSIDRLRSARAKREEYVGPWLPEPLVAESDAEGATPSGAVEIEESLSMAFLVLLESLSPTERAVFLLREVFGYGYGEIARIVGKGETNTRQIAHRARSAVEARRPRFDPSPEQGRRLTERFLAAARDGDLEGLLELLADEVTVWSDGGGRATAARNPIHGKERVARFFVGLAGKAAPGLVVRTVHVNGALGVVVYAEGYPAMVLSLDVEDERIRAVRVVLNPDKLGAVPPLR